MFVNFNFGIFECYNFIIWAFYLQVCLHKLIEEIALIF